ncbi:MAG: hypothetical protein ACOCX9_02340 [Spirochaetota bacterium]
MTKRYSLSVCSIFLSVLFLMAIALPLYSSDMSDAKMLREKSEKEIQRLEVCVKNFGDDSEKERFNKAQRLVKMGKLKITQSQFKDAIDKYNQYLKMQHNLYVDLAKKYINRTRAVNDEVSEDLVDHIDKPNVDKYFKLAYRNLKSASDSMNQKNPVQAIRDCRKSKEYSLGVYKLIGQTVPDKYSVDVIDIQGKIAGN